MKSTSGVVSNIAYCDKTFAEVRLRQAVKEGTIRFFAFVEHPGYNKVDKVTGEVSPRKTHLHLILEAGVQPVNLEKMRQYLEQIDPTNTKPLSVERWTKSNIDTWLAYSLHDLQYCKYKGLEKPYYDIPLESVVTSDPEYLRQVFEDLPRDKWKSDIDKILSYLDKGQNWVDYCRQELVPYNLIPIVRKSFNDIKCQIEEDAIRMMATEARQRLKDQEEVHLPEWSEK